MLHGVVLQCSSRILIINYREPRPSAFVRVKVSGFGTTCKHCGVGKKPAIGSSIVDVGEARDWSNMNFHMLDKVIDLRLIVRYSVFQDVRAGGRV